MRRVRVCHLYDEYLEGEIVSVTQEYAVPDNMSTYQIYLGMDDPEEVEW